MDSGPCQGKGRLSFLNKVRQSEAQWVLYGRSKTLPSQPTGTESARVAVWRSLSYALRVRR